MKLQKLLYIGVAGLVSLTSCSDFLDHLPDNRVIRRIRSNCS